MSSGVVLAAYACAAILPFVLLHFFGARAWYWHVLSICLAFALGFTPIPEQWRGPSVDLITGASFTLLLVWGVAAPLYIPKHRPHSRFS
jgi:hypothetical protein